MGPGGGHHSIHHTLLFRDPVHGLRAPGLPQRGDAASVRGRLPVRVARAAAVARGAIAGATALLSSLEANWMAAALLPAAAVFTARSVRGVPCGDVRAVSRLSVVQDLRDIAGNRSFKHVYICSRRRLSPVDKASAKELSASYSARGSIPAASAVEYHSVRSEKFPCDSGLVCLTQQPLQARTRPAPGFFFGCDPI